MFYVASAYLEGEELAFSSHSAVIAAFGQRFARTGRVPVHFHRYLINAMDIRTKADYNVEPNITKEDASQLIVRAQAFLEFAQQSMNFASQ
ncbi:HEPN domain-containing protein [Gloeocapsopsis dulcis]|uniref:HEPN domain-containing protein n=1 Tax=Gloeocapsopsis dulcis TaxID=2859516 RepID=UPI0018C71240|nr:HEPN domain-containing protein [Gloeocapsopsis dulcis]WNN87549.1 HEPN domain-containing protein [Gloeocapsopsis dulcis]